MIYVLALMVLFTRVVDQTDVFRPPARPAQSFAQMAEMLHANRLDYASPDGTLLRGFLFRARKPDAPYVLVFYGNAELAQFESDRLEWLRRLGYNAVCFDYRGYGYSGGSADAERIRDDSVAIYDYVVRDLERSHAPGFVYGVSLGTQFAIHVSAQRQVRALVLQSAAASADEEVAWYAHRFLGLAGVFVHVVPSNSVKLLFQGAAEIARSNSPAIVVHGTQDALIPIEQGREVFAAAASRDKQFVQVPGAGHGDIQFSRPPAGPAVASFLAAH